MIRSRCRHCGNGIVYVRSQGWRHEFSGFRQCPDGRTNAEPAD